jgi:hypothetical protein
VHAIGNAIVSIASFPEMIKTLKDPLGAFTGPMATMLPNSTGTSDSYVYVKI